MVTNEEKAGLTRIEKRAIEARAIAPMFLAIAKRLGKDEALALVKEVNQQEAYHRGQEMVNTKGQNGIQELVDEPTLLRGLGASSSFSRMLSLSCDSRYSRDHPSRSPDWMCR